jgi:hypothetical protein
VSSWASTWARLRARALRSWSRKIASKSLPPKSRVAAASGELSPRVVSPRGRPILSRKFSSSSSEKGSVTVTGRVSPAGELSTLAR